MNKPLLFEFLSEDNLNLHISHMKNEAAKYSILEKSIPELSGVAIGDIMRLGIKKEEREAALTIASCVEAHKIYFDSFAPLRKKCESVIKHFGSLDRFLYEVFECSRHESHGFTFVYVDKRKKPRIEFSTPKEELLKLSPILAIDLFEHAYFLDYGFKKEQYLRSAIARLDIEKLDIALTTS